MMGVYAIVEATNYGWGSAHTLGFGAGAVALLAAFVVREARAANPLVPLRIFRSRNLSGANVIQVLMVAGIYGMFFLGALYLQKVLGFDSLEVGLAFIPMTAIIGHPLARLLGQTEHALRGAGDAAAGPGLGRRGSAATSRRSRSTVATAPKCCRRWCWSAIGAGLSFPSVMTLAMSGVQPEEAGLASGLVNTTCRSAAPSGSPCWRRCRPAARRTWSPLATRTASALTSGYRLAFLVGAGLLLAALAVALAVLRSEPAAD